MDTQTLPWSHFILKNNYIYNRVKNTLMIPVHTNDSCKKHTLLLVWE